MPFRPPTHVPNSRRALETAEVVRALDPVPSRRSTRRCSRRTSSTERTSEIPTCSTVSSRAGAPSGGDAVDKGAGRAAVAASMTAAHDHGIAATPAWLFREELVLPGVQPRELFERVVARLRAQAG